MDFKSELKQRVDAANAAIEKILPQPNEHPGSLTAALSYSVTVGGKRIRPVLMSECYRIFGGSSNEIEPFMAAMEFIHTASLIHDDLPALDNDDLRRGQPTVHAKYGEAVGVVAGDALLNFAYETLIDGVRGTGDTQNALRAADIIAKKGGYRGMLGGQAADVECEKTGIEGEAAELLHYIYENKTGALIEGSMMAGAALAGADDSSLKLLEEAGSKTGLAFQIYDDILDIVSTTEVLGKPVLSDIKNEKDTYVSIYGLDAAKEKVKTLTKEAVSIVDGLQGNTEFLKALISYLAMREM